MKLTHINLSNFFGHKKLDLDFTNIKAPTLITGANGAGKTSAIVESITYAIFGQTRLATADDAIRHNTSEMSVSITFELNGQKIQIVRSKKRDKSQKLSMFVDDVQLDELASETQKRINKLFQLSYESFLSSIILRQEDADFFVNQKAEDRKRIIGEILDLSQYEVYEKIAREKRADLKAEIKSEQSILSGFEEVDIEELNVNLSKLDKFIAKFTKQIETKQSEFDELNAWNITVIQQEQQVKKEKERLENLKAKRLKIEQWLANKVSELDALNLFLKNFKNPESILVTAQESIDALEVEVFDLTEQIAFNNEKLMQLIKKEKEKLIEPLKTAEKQATTTQVELDTINIKLDKIKKLGQADCPTCLRPLDSNEIKPIEDALIKEKTKLNIKLEKVNKELEELEIADKAATSGRFEEHAKLKQKIEKFITELTVSKENLAKAKQIYQKKIKSQQEFTEKKAQADSIKNTLPRYEEEIKELKNEINDITITDIKIQKKDTSIIQKELSQLKNNYQEGIEAKIRIESDLELAIKNKDKKEELVNSVNGKIQELQIMEKLCIAFSRKGIPAIIIQTILPEIQDMANTFLSQMHNQLQMEFQTSEFLKNGDEKDTLKIQVHDGTMLRPFESYSGGERFRVSLAIRLALSKVLTRRAGIDLELLILDEPASPLDPEGRELFVRTIKGLTKSFSCIFIMSHLLDLKESFEHRINISK